VDIAAPLGSPVFAADDGIVKFAGKNGGYGLMILIDHGTYQTVYGHLSKIDVFKGQYVKKGQLIGRIGSTGISTGPHLHFEVRIHNKHTNPLAYLPSPKRMYVYREDVKWAGGE
jgi:murein DD-endopeptidase MepM/ murein hydrolase activator NlpD